MGSVCSSFNPCGRGRRVVVWHPKFQDSVAQKLVPGKLAINDFRIKCITKLTFYASCDFALHCE